MSVREILQSSNSSVTHQYWLGDFVSYGLDYKVRQFYQPKSWCVSANALALTHLWMDIYTWITLLGEFWVKASRGCFKINSWYMFGIGWQTCDPTDFNQFDSKKSFTFKMTGWPTNPLAKDFYGALHCILYSSLTKVNKLWPQITSIHEIMALLLNNIRYLGILLDLSSHLFLSTQSSFLPKLYKWSLKLIT